MSRYLLVVAAAVLFAPPPAAAAPFGELPFQQLDGTPSCLQATGAPGEVVRRTPSGAQFLQAGTAGLEPVGQIAFETKQDCPRVAARANGAAVLAIASTGELKGAQAFLREPGGEWGPAVQVLQPPQAYLPGTPTVALSDRGDALVAMSVLDGALRNHVMVTVRAAGAAFGAPQTLMSTGARNVRFPTIRAGITATGEAVVAFAVPPARETPGPRPLFAAIAPPGGRFGTPQRVGEVHPGSSFDLDVAADGRAVLAFPAGDGLRVAERAPGEGFSAAARLAAAADILGLRAAVAVRAGGGAIVAWTGYLGRTVTALVRDRPGPFGEPLVVSRQREVDFLAYDPLALATWRWYYAQFGTEAGAFGEEIVSGGARLSAALADDGRAILTWSALQRRDGVWWPAARSATLGRSGVVPESRTHGAELRTVGALAPVLLAGGVRAVAWTDTGSNAGSRLHLAAEGAADRADPAPPRVRVRAPARRALRDDAPLILPVTCSAACDVRAQVEGSDFDAGGELSLDRAGAGRLRLESSTRPLARLDGGPVRVLVRYGAPGVRRPATRTLSFRLRRVRLPPVRIVGLTARRDGDEVVVRWHVARPAHSAWFTVLGLASRDDDALPISVDGPSAAEPDEHRRRYEVRLPGAPATRWVVLLSETAGLAVTTRRTTVRVRG